MKTFNTADICEEAHRLTTLKCKRLGIEVDAVDEDDDDEIAYTDQAKLFFDEFFEAIEEKWEADKDMKRE
jgi:hypothetical protein